MVGANNLYKINKLIIFYVLTPDVMTTDWNRSNTGLMAMEASRQLKLSTGFGMVGVRSSNGSIINTNPTDTDRRLDDQHKPYDTDRHSLEIHESVCPDTQYIIMFVSASTYTETLDYRLVQYTSFFSFNVYNQRKLSIVRQSKTFKFWIVETAKCWVL